MFDYEYLESQTQSHMRLSENSAYELHPDIRFWISAELEKRRQRLTESESNEVTVYLTTRTFRKSPVFVFATPTEAGKHVLEAWYFHFVENDEQDGALQLVLDRVALKMLFPEQMPKARS